MGMFDSVYCPCPNPECAATVEFQSKGGLCVLKNYDSSRVPTDVAFGLGAEYIAECKACGRAAFPVISPPIPSFVAVTAAATPPAANEEGG